MITIKDISFAYRGMGLALGLNGRLTKDAKAKARGDVKVLNGISIDLNEGNIYGLLGRNGIGKSTLLYLISGLLRPQSGTICMDGTETRLRRPETLGEIFIVPEELELPPVSLESYVRTYAPFYPRFSHDTLQACLNDFDLPQEPHFGRLSMGQKKKVFMSFALATNTKLLLMDEPTNGLDIPSKSIFRRVVAQGMDERRTIVISTHQVHDVEQLLDHVIMIGNDGVQLDASVADICSQYAFGIRQPGEPMDDVLYAEPTLQGNAVITRRHEDAPETDISLELLFNAVNEGKVTFDKNNDFGKL